MPPFRRDFLGFFGKGTKKSIFAVLKRHINTINSALLNFSSGGMEKLFFADELSSLENFRVLLPEDAKIIQGTFDTVKLRYEKINEFSSQL